MNKLCEKIPKNSIKLFGSGGSQTVIIITPDKKVYKYFINFSYMDTKYRIKKEKEIFKTEIDIQKEITEKIINKNLSPHIVEIKNYKYCNTIPKFLFKNCPNYKKLLLTKKDKNEKLPKECLYLIRGHPVNIEKGFYIMNIEYCSITLDKVIKKIMRKSNKNIKKYLDNMLFQIIYTLAVLQKKYPYFIHRDLFIRNILATENKISKNKYNRYYFNKYIFDIPIFEYTYKITDFGQSNLNKKISYRKKLIKSPYEDVFNFIYDIYNGENLGSKSCIYISKKRKNKKKELFIHKYFSNFINTKIIKKIEKNNKKKYLDNEWHKFYDPKIKNLLKVKLPSEYLKYFSKIYPIKEDHNIVNIYGKHL